MDATQEHLNSGSSGITVWPHCSQTYHSGRCNIGRGPLSKGAVGAAYDPIYHSWCLPPLAVPFLEASSPLRSRG